MSLRPTETISSKSGQVGPASPAKLPSTAGLGPNDQLHRRIKGHFMNPQGRARVPASLAEYCVDEIGCAVEDLRMLAKPRAAMDVALQAHDLTDLIEIAEHRFELRQRIERADFGGLVT